jgi:hypothetical protein
MTTVRRTVALLAAALIAVPGVLHASEAALGNDGRLFRVTAGTYADLFPEGTAAEPDAPVLALDVSKPGEPKLRQLVPGSETAARDLSPVLVFEPGSATAYVVWESRRDAETSAILLAGRNTDGWIGPVELSGDAAPQKGAPKVLITRDELRRPSVTEGQVLEARTVLHIVWWEQAGAGDAAVQYTPVVIENGAYIGWNPVFRLDSLDPHEPVAKPPGASDLFRSPALSSGTDVHTAMIAFANAKTDRLLTVQARVLPGELGLLADRIPDAVVAAGYSEGADRLEAIRGALRSQIIEIGGRFNPGVIDHFAASAVAAAESLHAAKPNRPIGALGDDLRSQIIEIGANVLGGVDRPTRAKASRVLEAAGPEPETDGTLSNLVYLRLVRDLPVPEAGEGPSKIYASEDGSRLLVSWQSEEGTFFTESLPEAGEAEAGAEAAGAASWTEPLALELAEARPDPGEVDAILRARVLQRP